MVLDLRSDRLPTRPAPVVPVPRPWHRAGRYIFLINEIAHQCGVLLTGLLPLGEAFLTLIGMFVVMWFLDPQVALTAAAVVPLVYVATTRFGKGLESRLLRVRELEGGSIRIVHEKISMVRVVVAFCREKYEHSSFYRQAQEAVGARVQITIAQTVFGLIVASSPRRARQPCSFITATAVSRGDLSIGDLTVILTYVRSAYQPIQQITGTLTHMQMQLVQIDLLFDSLDAPPEVVESPDAHELADPTGQVTFEDVSFDYRDREGTLHDVSFRIEPGEFVAIVGPTGAGKSTLVSLMPRFYDPQRGPVLLDGHDVRDLDARVAARADRRRPPGAAALLRHASPRTSATAASTRPTTRSCEAARHANAHDFIMALPDGYETTLGERGARLSGGERQRISVARAFLKDAPILILDEPTSSIDSQTESGHPRRARPADGRADDVHDRPPAVDHPRRRPHPGARRRPARRAGHARGAAGTRRPLRQLCAPDRRSPDRRSSPPMAQPVRGPDGLPSMHAGEPDSSARRAGATTEGRPARDDDARSRSPASSGRRSTTSSGSSGSASTSTTSRPTPGRRRC